MNSAHSFPRSYFAELVPEKLDYDAYLVWLADFLMQLPEEIPEAQRKLWLSLQNKSPEDIAWELGEYSFWHAMYIDPLISRIWHGDDYQSALRDLTEEWQGMYADADPENREQLESWINPAMWADAGRECSEIQAAGIKKPTGEKIDQGYRAILASLVKQAVSKEDRIAVLHTFFKSYNDIASQ